MDDAGGVGGVVEGLEDGWFVGDVDFVEGEGFVLAEEVEAGVLEADVVVGVEVVEADDAVAAG